MHAGLMEKRSIVETEAALISWRLSSHFSRPRTFEQINRENQEPAIEKKHVDGLLFVPIASQFRIMVAQRQMKEALGGRWRS